MPNGTYGGVRGEAGDGFTYSIGDRGSGTGYWGLEDMVFAEEVARAGKH